MLPRIAGFIDRHGMLLPGSALGVAVSGGVDSTFLLHVLHTLAPRWNVRLSVIHIDHGIRGGASADDARFVESLAATYGLPFHLHRADARASGDNLEQAARTIRRDFYARLIASRDVDRIATGHTRGDQAETVLYRILRGSGLQGLCGILPVTAEGLIRPLLELDRAEIEAWMREHQHSWREDETNQDRAYARNRLRHETLPLLRATFNPKLDEALANLATLAGDEERYWESQLPDAGTADGPILLSARELASAPSALARRRIRRAIEQVKGDLRQIEFAHIERILAMAQASEGHDRVQIPGLDIFRSFDWVRFAKISTSPRPDFVFPLQPPASVELPGDSARITLQVLEKTECPGACGTVGNELDWQRLTSLDGVSPGLELRNWRPGDQYQRVGQSEPQKIKFLFQEARVPLWDRRNWPIITYNGAIIWARRFGAAADFAAGPLSRLILRVGESGSSNCQVSDR